MKNWKFLLAFAVLFGLTASAFAAEPQPCAPVYEPSPCEPVADVGPCEPVYAPVCGPVGESVAAQTVVVVTQAPRPPKFVKREVVRNWDVARTRRVFFNERKIERRRVEKVRVRSGGGDVRVDSGCASVGCKVGG
ncbi:MAG: hypothetical protein IKW13_07030 [Thermoguttaceae bacterium]|nr:hypothetical protein [Thermoguttaceae bacterium]